MWKKNKDKLINDLLVKSNNYVRIKIVELTAATTQALNEAMKKDQIYMEFIQDATPPLNQNNKPSENLTM